MQQQHRGLAQLSWAVVLLAAGFFALSWWAGPVAHADDDDDWVGVVEAMPAGMIGQWTIGGRTVTADERTEFNQEDGRLAVGVCAEVKFEDDRSAAEEISYELMSKCTGDDGTGTPRPSRTPDAGPTPTRTPGHDDDRDVYGFIEQMPAGGRQGTWVIGGVQYSADANTEFEQDYGAFAVGVCVEVDYEEGSPRRATEIETKQSYKCSRGDDNGSGDDRPHGELYGVLESFPSGWIGEWKIGGMTFQASSRTEIKQEGGPFEVGKIVKVEFYVDSAGVNQALEIKTRWPSDDDDDDDDRREGEDGHAYGVINSFPAGLVGEWIIGGLSYTADSRTEFEQEGRAFAEGVKVRVEYVLSDGGARRAKEIKTTDDNGGVDDGSHFKLLGYVKEMPANGFVGVWKVGDVTFEADATGKFKENHGIFALGAYVEVEYYLAGGVRKVHEMETQVAPGGGDNTRVGRIERRDDSAAAATVSANPTWVIGGVSYTVTAATKLSDSDGALAVDGTARVNSYAAADGSQTATLIEGITLDQRVFLPAAMR